MHMNHKCTNDVIHPHCNILMHNHMHMQQTQTKKTATYSCIVIFPTKRDVSETFLYKQKKQVSAFSVYKNCCVEDISDLWNI